MNWQNEAIEDLKKYSQMKESLQNIQERITALELDLQTVKSKNFDAEPVQGGVDKYEDHVINNIVERQRLECAYNATEKIVNLIEKGLASLDEKERLVLQRFYIDSAKKHVEKLMEELNYEQRRIYQLKDKAIFKFTITMYGILDY